MIAIELKTAKLPGGTSGTRWLASDRNPLNLILRSGVKTRLQG
jgi:hypothetical protein